MTWASGSPRRALHSRSAGPSAVSISPAYRNPRKGAPRRASSARSGRWTVSRIASTAASSRSASGEYAPIPPVFGPSSPSSNRLWSRAAGSATARLPSHSAITLASAPSSRSSMTSGPAAARSTIARASSRGWPGPKTVTPLPPASPSAFTTNPLPRCASRWIAAAASAGVVATVACAIRTPAASATSWQNALELSIRAAARVGPKTAIPASPSASAIPAASGASGPMTTSSAASARARATTAAPSSVSTVFVRTRASCAIPSDPGATMTSFTPGSSASFQASACSRPPPPTMRIRVG